jgi:hypothetical protein
VSEVPRFDGSGPQGQGPMTGRGEGYCVIKIGGPGEAPYGYAGLQGTPVGPGAPAARRPPGLPFAGGLRPATPLGRFLGMRRGRGPGRRRGRRGR